MEENIDVGVIYIIGNEELGELEHYNKKENKYEGLIPNFFKKVSEKSRIEI